jgi:hypothetical protein
LAPASVRANAATLIERVALASARTYQDSGYQVHVRTDGVTYELAIPAIGRVEIIESVPPSHTDALLDLRDRREAGLDVWAVVELENLAAAHATYRKVVDRLQPWWVVDDEIVFGTPRIP